MAGKYIKKELRLVQFRFGQLKAVKGFGMVGIICCGLVWFSEVRFSKWVVVGFFLNHGLACFSKLWFQMI